MSDLLRKKDYPLNYPTDVLNLISTMSFSNGRDVKVVGSMSLKSQQYAGDYDCYEIVQGKYKTKATAVKAFVKRFQDIVRAVMRTKDCYIGDIKAGLVKEWEVIPESAGIRNGRIVGYDADTAREKVKALWADKVLTEQEYKYASRVLVDDPTINQFLLFKKELRFHLVRWTPEEVLQGHVKLRDGRDYTLEQAIESPTIAKLDVVAYVENSRFTDFSIIYLFRNNGQAINEVNTGDEEWAIKQDLLYYLAKENYFKVAKRLFSLARKAGDTSLIEKLNDLLNSDGGRLYSIISDVGTLLYLLENEKHLPLEKIQYELDQFRSRLGNVYSIKGVGSDSILSKLISAEGLPNTTKGRFRLFQTLTKLQTRFESVLSSYSKQWMDSEGILPIDKKYMP